MKKLILKIRIWFYNYRVRQAKKQADELAANTGKKYLVLLEDKWRPVVVEKQQLKRYYHKPSQGWDRFTLYTAFPPR